MATLSSSALITADGLKEIIDSDLTDSRLNNFINMAVIVMAPLTAASLSGCGGSDALTQIQLLLAAHFLTLYERTTKSESIGGEWSVTYAIQDGPGFNASLYGQQALALDCSGTLGKLGLRRASFAVTSYYQTKKSSYLFDSDLLS